MALRLGEIFIKHNLINTTQLDVALKDQSQNGGFLGEIIVRLGFATEEDLLKVLAEQFNTHYVTLSNVRINPVVIKLVPQNLVSEHKFMPIEMRSSIILIAVSNPLDMWPMSVLQDKLDLSEVQIVLAKKNDILETIKKYYGAETGGM